MDIGLLANEYFGNTLKAYLWAFLIFAALLGVFYFVEKVLIRRLRRLAQKTESASDDFIIDTLQKAVIPVLYFMAFYLAIRGLDVAPALGRLIHAALVIVLTVQAVRFASALAGYVIGKTWARQAETVREAAGQGTVIKMAQFLLWGLGLVFILDNLGFDVAAIAAGLGIGGVAVALAAQTILGDLFNYFVIFFDKPFKIGDFIVVDDHLGVIEHIGIKTTRIRSLGGEQLVFANSDLTSSRVRNYKRMEERRVLFKVGVTYQTTAKQLKKIPEIVREIIQAIPDTKFDRAHFKEFGDFSLDIEIVYYVFGSDYNKYMDVQQEINWAIKERFEREGIEFAYPTQTLYHVKESK